MLVGFGSLVACIKFTQSNPVLAYYMLPTRAWELIAGSLLAVLPLTSPTSKTQEVIIRILPSMGLLLIAGSLVMIQEGLNFPGWRAIFPVAGAIAIIFSLRDTGKVGWERKTLSSLPMVWIGKISFSLYLWHWPVFSLIDYQFYLISDALRIAIKLVLSLLLAFIGFRYIETPARIFLNQPKHRKIAYVSFITVLALSVGLGLAIRNTYHINAKLVDVTNGGLVFLVKPGPISVVLMGDSLGVMYSTTLKEICKDLDKNLIIISVDGGDPLPQRDGNSNKLWLDSLDVIRKSKPKYLVMANHWVDKLEGNSERLAMAIKELEPFVEQIVLLNQPPMLPNEVNRESFRAGLRPPFRELMDIQSKRSAANDLLLGLKSPSVSVINVARYFETNDGNIRFTDERGQHLYQDATHLSGHGAEKIRNALKEAISLP
jgi:hypothetical protein